MLSLAEFQFTMAADLLDGGMRTARLLPGDPAFVREALRVHRNTVLSGLANALRLTYPTVAWLTGQDFFDQAAHAFVTGHPPRAACLSDYGDGFAEFLESHPPAAMLPYLGDVARFDLAIERCGNASPYAPACAIALDGETTVELDGSLVTLAVEYPVDQLRDAHDKQDADCLASLDMSPRARNFAIWHHDGAATRQVSQTAASFLGAALRGESAEAALAACLLHADPDEALAAIQSEIFAAPFARILSQSRGE